MKKELYIIIHNVRSAHNVGSIFRTADGAGVKKIYLTGYTPFPAGKKDVYLTPAQKMIAKTALGAENFMNWKKSGSVFGVIKKLRKEKIKIIALEQGEESIDMNKFKFDFPTALILGNEIEGIEKKTINFCDASVFIPMRGKKESLNVSVAAGIAMYKILK
jgi:tRNA G18 (ribose-2'-O)-methylase SpoU